MSLHPLLARQLRRLGVDPGVVPDAERWQAFVEQVNRAYEEADQDRYTAGRSLDLVSQEMQALYEDLRLRSEADLSEERGRLQAVVGAIGHGVCVLDRRGWVVAINDAGARLLGVRAEEAVGQEVLVPARLGGEAGEGFRVALRQALTGEVPPPQDVQILDGSGQRLDVRFVLRPLSHDGQPLGAVLVCQEVTAATRGSSGSDRAAAAQASARAVSEVLTALSHQLRTPLNGLIGFAELLLETPLDTAQRDYVTTIRACGDGLAQVVGDLLDLWRIEAGTVEVDRVEFDPRFVVEEAVAAVAAAAHRRRTELLCAIGQDLPTRVVGDPARVGQVVSKLLGHAVQVTEGGEISVDVGVGRGSRVGRVDDVTGPDDPGAVQLRIEVADSGPGLSPERLAGMLGAGHVADVITSSGVAANGELGLTVARRLVHLMGGRFEVRSQAGRGTTVTVWLPVIVAASATGPAAGRYLPSAARVLCVDDNERQRQLLARQLAALGMRVATAGDVLTAFDTLRWAIGTGERVAAVFADVEMPGLGGLDLARLMAAEGRLTTVPVILLSPTGDTARVAARPPANVAAVVQKPVRLSVLVEVLGTAIGWAEPARETLPTVASPTGGGADDTMPQVLVAEDDTINQRVILAQLRRLGLRPTLARNGLEAVQAASAQRFDLILMDCQMPEMDGFEATRAIRALGGWAQEVPIVALTASAAARDRERCLLAGMTDHLAKPVDHQRLASTLGRWLQRVIAA